MFDSSENTNFAYGLNSVLNAFSEEMFNYSCSLDGKLLDVSDSISSILGYSKKDFLEKYKTYLNNNSDNSNFCCGLSDTNTKRKFILEVKNCEGKIFIFEVYEAYVENRGIYGIARNVTEDANDLKLLSSRLKEKEERLNLAFDASDEGFWDYSFETEELFLSKRCYTLLGLKPDNRPSTKLKNWYDKIYTEDLARIRRVISEEKLLKSDYASAEFRAKTSDGDFVWILIEFKVVKRGILNKPLRIVGTAKDVTLRKNTEVENERLIVQLEEAVGSQKLANEKLMTNYSQLENIKNKLEIALSDAQEGSTVKTAFLNIISHELRTPLSGILGFSQLLLRVGELNKKQLLYVDYIMKAGRNLLKVLTDIIDISALEAKSPPIEINEFCINQLVSEIVSKHSDEISSKGISFDIDIPPETFMVSDKNKVYQILFNLISNAIKFSMEGNISVVCKEEKNKYILKISDTGIGVELSKKDMIFESFTQIETYDKRKYGGLGIGLAITKKLVEILGGTISLEEGSSSSGSVFVVEFPIKGSPSSFNIPYLKKKSK